MATAYWDTTHKTVLLKDGVLEKEGDAYGFFNDSLSNTGWGVLELRAGYGKTQETDDVTYFLAGYLEGFLTAEYAFFLSPNHVKLAASETVTSR